MGETNKQNFIGLTSEQTRAWFPELELYLRQNLFCFIFDKFDLEMDDAFDQINSVTYGLNNKLFSIPMREWFIEQNILNVFVQPCVKIHGYLYNFDFSSKIVFAHVDQALLFKLTWF